jgi:hypothetical protein
MHSFEASSSAECVSVLSMSKERWGELMPGHSLWPLGHGVWLLATLVCMIAWRSGAVNVSVRTTLTTAGKPSDRRTMRQHTMDGDRLLGLLG